MKTKTFRFVKWARNYLGNLTKTARKLNKRIDVKISSNGKTIQYWIVNDKKNLEECSKIIEQTFKNMANK